MQMLVMKKWVLSGVALTVCGLLTASAIAQEKRYQCHRYVNDSPTGGWIHVRASSKEEATVKAMARFRELGGRVDSANCHYDP